MSVRTKRKGEGVDVREIHLGRNDECVKWVGSMFCVCVYACVCEKEKERG